MVTDGVLDAITEEKLVGALYSEKSFNPQSLCDKLVDWAKSQNANDDLTAIAFRLTKSA